LFFYDAPVSQAIAFEHLPSASDLPAADDAFSDSAIEQLVHVATDGESYGHHHRCMKWRCARCSTSSANLAHSQPRRIPAASPTHEA
jgi:hypothetical protein